MDNNLQEDSMNMGSNGIAAPHENGSLSFQQLDTLPPKFSAGGAIRTTTDAINNTPLEGRRRTTSAHNHRQNAPYSVPASGNNNPTTNDANKSSPVHTYNASTDSLASSVETSGARSPPVLFSGSGVDEAQNHAEDFAAQRRSSLASIASVTTTSDERGSGRTSPPSSQHDARLDGGAINCGRAAIFHQPHSQQSSRVPLPQSLPQYASNRHQSQHHLPRQLAGTTHSAAAVAAAVAAAAQRRYSLSSAVMPASMSTMAHPPPRQRAVSTFVAGPAAFPYAREEVTRDSNGEVACRICGKRYKNSVCLNKHAWEHHQYWNYTKKLMHNKHQSVQIMEAAQSLMNLFNGGSTSTVSPVVAHGINAAPYLADFVADDDDDEVVAVAATGGTATAEPACGASSSMSSTSSTTPDSPPETRR